MIFDVSLSVTWGIITRLLTPYQNLLYGHTPTLYHIWVDIRSMSELNPGADKSFWHRHQVKFLWNWCEDWRFIWLLIYNRLNGNELPSSRYPWWGKMSFHEPALHAMCHSVRICGIYEVLCLHFQDLEFYVIVAPKATCQLLENWQSVMSLHI